MAGEMIAMLHGLGGGRRYGLGDLMSDANAAFAEMDSILQTAQNVIGTTMGGQPAITRQIQVPAVPLLDKNGNMILGPDGRILSVGAKTVTIGSPKNSIDDLIRRRQQQQGDAYNMNYDAPKDLGTDWSVYALPVGILLAAAGVAWYMTRPKAL